MTLKIYGFEARSCLTEQVCDIAECLAVFVAHNELLHGLPAATPVAVIQNASLPSQRYITATLGALATAIYENAMCSPSIIVVGDVMGSLALASAHPETARAA